MNHDVVWGSCFQLSSQQVEVGSEQSYLSSQISEAIWDKHVCFAISNGMLTRIITLYMQKRTSAWYLDTPKRYPKHIV